MIRDRATSGRVGIMVLTTVAYLVLFFPLWPIFDMATAILALGSVLLAGAFFGTFAGAVAGVLGVVITDGLITILAPARAPTIYLQAVMGVVGFVGAGVVAGRMRDLGNRVGQQRAALEKERARLARELVAREEYTSVVVHELRNPLLAIGATLRLLARDAVDESVGQRLRAAAAESTRALDLLDGLNDVSSLESGRMRSVLRPTDLNVVVRGAVDAMETLGGQVSLRVSEQPVTVLGDERRLGQIVRNLVGNAAKYSPPGAPVEVTVGLDQARVAAVVRVRDYGPGVPPGERDRLFQKFARLSTAGSTSGSGLGLYISRGIIRDHGGDIAVEWPSGGGTAFSVTLPLAPG